MVFWASFQRESYEKIGLSGVKMFASVKRLEEGLQFLEARIGPVLDFVLDQRTIPN